MKKKKFMKTATPYIFISPWIIGFLVFTIGPLILSLVMSFFDWPLTSTREFIGFGNYIEMFTQDKQFWKSLGISLKYAAIFVPLNLIIALFLAMLITQPLRGVKIYRTIFYIPSVVSGVAVSIIWGWILNGDYGALNYLLSLIGIKGPKWLIDPAWALFAVIIASAFGVGSMMLIFYTDIKNIPGDVYEAASLDGANAARQFFSITLPMITPTILFNLITSIIGSFQQVTLVMLLTGGGPLKKTYFYGLYTYNNAFKHHKMGYASANAWVMFVIILLLTAFVFRSSSAWVFYESEVKNENSGKRKGKRRKNT
ncbi:sugar ABC transporter permease [Blautia liquoris]|uniref:Sugar ABC transporter permease n=1 Tax=Blautia liquoris TaxID=2779518 RepID=A0A7M2RED7_9FIRM|nr:sugar ABC transporter permease [Blautia liquoris]QOV18599.1 sugar ABC transporter permease [Blautia liquoris]